MDKITFSAYEVYDLQTNEFKGIIFFNIGLNWSRWTIIKDKISTIYFTKPTVLRDEHRQQIEQAGYKISFNPKFEFDRLI